MFHTLDEFLATWSYESSATQTLLEGLTDASLPAAVRDDGRTIARLSWHIVQTIPEMMARTGVHVSGVGEHDPVPRYAVQIADAYKAASASLVHELRQHWTDATLSKEDDMYGEQWTRARTLTALVFHQVHHRGQLTVLMRQAGLPVTGIYGPAMEEWASMGMTPPEV